MTEGIDASLPTAKDPTALHRDIFAHLTEAKVRSGSRVMVHDGALFSRLTDCPGVIALLDPADVRFVLTDAIRFSLPPSAAGALQLPDDLAGLNRSLHSLNATAHRAQRAPLVRAISAIEGAQASLVERALARHPLADPFPLLATMRSLTGDVAARALFGDDVEAEGLGRSLSIFLMQRRAATAIDALPLESAHRDLVIAGREAAAGLKARVSAAVTGGPSLVDQLAGMECFSGDELAAHLNILYLSSSEPLAIVLAWTLLLLSQCPELAGALHQASDTGSRFSELVRPVLLESMRLLTPNALMTRVVAEPVSLDGFLLARGTEILLAPLIMHRDPGTFADPGHFAPERWRGLSPKPFAYLPFGGGTHACIGSAFAFQLLTAMLRELLRVCARPALARSEFIDWRMAIVFQPAAEIMVRPFGSDFPPWRGPASNLVDIYARA
jgi:cytochrome P450